MHPGSFAPNAAPNSPSSLPPPRSPDVGPGAGPAASGSTGASPFALSPGRDDTGLYQDARTGFSHLLPGRPMRGMPSARPGEPPCDSAIHLQDAPITIRYRLDPPMLAASSAAELAHATAERFASWRAQNHANVDHANDSWLGAWGVEAAAVAAYDVSPPTDAAATGPGAPLLREDLFVLVRHGMVLSITWTYPRGFVDDPAYATFASVAEATMVWDANRWEQRGRVWPDGAFLGPGLFGAPTLRFNESAKQLAASNILPDERNHVLGILSGVVSGAGAPWVPLAPEVVDGNKRAILSAVRHERLRSFIEEAFTEVRTAHDLRGLAVILGRALDGRRVSSSMPPPMPGGGPVLRPPPQARIHY